MGGGSIPREMSIFIHQDLDPGMYLIDAFRFCGGVCVYVVEFTEEIIGIGQVHLLLAGCLRTPPLADVL
jgi:hypothetical protein